MRENKIFNKYLFAFFVIILLFARGVKVHSVLTEPNVSDWNYRQIERINKNRDNFSFVVFGDNKNSTKTFDNLISRINKENILFAIDDGDLVYDGEKAKFRFFLNQIKKIDKPLLTVFGNHEAREQGRANYYDIFGPFYYSFIIGDNYFIVLDDSNEMNLGNSQLDWLRKQLRISQNYTNRFVFMHVPLYDPREGNYKKGHSLQDLFFAKELNSLFDKSNITMLFVSHIHAYYKGVWGKTPYIITGGAGAELAGSDPAHYFYHYIRVKVNGSNIQYNVVKLKSPDFELIDRWIHDAWIYIYAFFALHSIDTLLLLSIVYLSIYIIILKQDWIIRKMRKFK